MNMFLYLQPEMSGKALKQQLLLEIKWCTLTSKTITTAANNLMVHGQYLDSLF